MSEKICKECKNCFYKSCGQVAWLQEKNEKLKTENEELKEKVKKRTFNIHITCEKELLNKKVTCRKEIENHNIKAENKLLKEKNEKLKEFCIELEKQKERQHNQWFTRCTENHNEDSKIIDNYRSTLEEIREIAKIHCKACDEFEIKRKLINCPYCNYNKILNKINEVIGAEECQK